MSQLDNQHTQQSRPTNTYAIIGLVSSILGLVGFALVGPILGVVFGMMAKKQILETHEDGIGLAQAAIILGIIQLVIGALILLFIIGLILVPLILAGMSFT